MNCPPLQKRKKNFLTIQMKMKNPQEGYTAIHKPISE